MKTFLIQSKNNQPIHDFSFHLIEAISYNNWYNRERIYDYYLNENPEATEYIPIGSVEFVLDTLLLSHKIDNIRPVNIPQELIKPEYLKRKVWFTKEDTEIINAGDKPIFVKDNTKIKGFTNIITKNCNYPPGEYLISDVINIESEWRAFIFQNKLVGLNNYSGNFTIFPDVNLINQMIKDYRRDDAYTLDVGINENGTFLIECHDFFSCGLYGFCDHILLPRMFISSWNKLIEKR